MLVIGLELDVSNLRQRARTAIVVSHASIMVPFLLGDPASWGVPLGIVAVAVSGKIVGSMMAARLAGLSWRESFQLGALLNTRGLVELVALNIGYDLGILTPRIFSLLVLMALITKCMTGPLLDLSSWMQRRGWPFAAAAR